MKVFQVLLVFVFSCYLSTIKSQTNAFAFPIENITIDGNFNDWDEENLHWYKMVHYHEYDKQSNEDFSVQFATAYNEKQQSVYIAVRVLDDEFVSDPTDGEDYMLLYLDICHDINGGSSAYYTATDKVLDVNHKPGKYDTRNQSLTLDKARMVRKRVGNITQYEWKITIGDLAKPNTILGLDFMMGDYDKSNNHETILLWKAGFGKSHGSNRLGDLTLLEHPSKIGKVSGKVTVDSSNLQQIIQEINIVSTENPDIWIKAELDTSGYFQAFIPEGNYILQPRQWFTSPINSSGFNQNTRRFQYSSLDAFNVVPNSITKIDPISVAIIPQPKLELPKGKGLPIQYLTTEQIDQFVKDWQAYYDIPALSIALIRNNKVFYENHSGIQNHISKKSVDNQTLFEAASITKSVFAVMVLRLAERGIIDLDKPLHEYLAFPNIENDKRSKLLTARIVLGHQSGLPNWAWNGPGTWEGAGDLQLQFDPGTKFGYSGEAFNYLGRVIEHVTGKDMKTLFEEEIEKPFDIKDSYFYYTDEQESRFALGHMHQYPILKKKVGIPSPASSLCTNASLFKGFALGLMNEKSMKPATFNLIYEPYTLLDKEDKIYDPNIHQHVSHGFFVQKTKHGKLIGHGGNNGDYDCKFAYNPEQKFAYIIFTNSNLGDEFIRALEQFLLQ